KVHSLVRGYAENGLHNTIMAPVWSSARITMDFREAQYSDWEYPEWIPHADRWHLLSHSEAEIYLPLQTTSPPFCIRREGLKEDSDPHILGRGERILSLRTYILRDNGEETEGWECGSSGDGSSLCPLTLNALMQRFLWGALCGLLIGVRHCGVRLPASMWRYIVTVGWTTGTGSKLHTPDPHCSSYGASEPSVRTKGLVASAASLSYGLAVDDGCIWDLKFCPSGGWEPPGTPRKGPEMARLGLLRWRYPVAMYRSTAYLTQSLSAPTEKRREKVGGY
ncbi:unnamed protein product, partial [Ranitomeya imitator]